METNQKKYKIFDQSEAIEKAQILLNKIKKNQVKMNYIRLDINTIVGIKATRKNTDQIINKLKNNRKKISLIEQIEYGNYA